jgi:hypothetical protein
MDTDHYETVDLNAVGKLVLKGASQFILWTQFSMNLAFHMGRISLFSGYEDYLLDVILPIHFLRSIKRKAGGRPFGAFRQLSRIKTTPFARFTCAAVSQPLKPNNELLFLFSTILVLEAKDTLAMDITGSFLTLFRLATPSL